MIASSPSAHPWFHKRLARSASRTFRASHTLRAPRAQGGPSALAMLAALGVFLGVGFPAPALAVDEFHAFLLPELPDTVCVPWHTVVDVPYWVDSSARQFNAYDLTVTFDPEILTPDTLLEGSLFTDACPNRWWRFSWTDSSMSCAHVLLCAGVSVDGPGSLCRLRLYADTLGITALAFALDPDRSFYDDGLYVWPGHPTYPRQVILHSAVVKVYDPTADAPPPVERAGSPGLLVRPNPARDACRFDCLLPGSGEAALSLAGPDGRLVARWTMSELPAGLHTVAWDAHDAVGRPLPAGVYFLRLEAGGASATRRLLLVR